MKRRFGTGRRVGAILAFAMALPTVGACGSSGAREIKPANINEALAAARDGDVLVLGRGDYDNVVLKGRKFARPLVIDASAATFTGFRVLDSEGVTVRGGVFKLPAGAEALSDGGRAISIDRARGVRIERATFIGPGATSYEPGGAYGEGTAVKVTTSTDVEVRGSVFRAFRRGVSFSKSEDFVIADNTFEWMRSDGINVALSRKGRVENNHCKSTRVREKEHPDCIQLWSRPEAAPTADIVIRGNRAEGPTQGIGAFNHVRDGKDDGGYDRITIENNIINVSRPNAITLVDGRDSVVRNNQVATLPGARWRAKIRVRGDVRTCGNTVGEWEGRSKQTERGC
ncbi:nitrous oxide reductase family maturation protein NosD [Phenylobacterium sp.]|uniref:right-handed parallel beta-helix repeat-containing protein n=1 Tax=Phenylobacterium sp. TaxID=1871053 RepID=UPI0025E9B6E6|nr:right-handed parallel beta-helix repeat-containing protein [Phenylobacterium sp.]MBX3483730.1 right-handed parallel beta-helix repeat-containing protein [Phenylobacterium sp.]MCW5758145.1 right-handed parallel beta-helix repeat-containing protein [Phenylobacterium sp.]